MSLETGASEVFSWGGQLDCQKTIYARRRGRLRQIFDVQKQTDFDIKYLLGVSTQALKV